LIQIPISFSEFKFVIWGRNFLTL